MTSQSVGYKEKAFEPRNLLFFFLIAFGWSWFWWGLFIFGILELPTGIGTAKVDFAAALPIILIVLFAPYGPTIAGFVMAARTEGKPGAKALWKRFWNRRPSLKWLTVCLLFFPALQLAANLVTRTLDGQAYPLMAYPSLGVFINALVFDGLIHGGMSEEFGWRGYALPRLQARWNALVSSIMLGVIWAAWHIPLWYFPGDEHSQTNFWKWASLLIVFSIMMTWIFNNTNGSVLAAVLFHALANASNSLFWCCGTAIWHRNGLWWLVAILLVSIFGPKSLVRQKAAQNDMEGLPIWRSSHEREAGFTRCPGCTRHFHFKHHHFYDTHVFWGKPGHWIGIPILLMAFPLGFLLLKAGEFNRPALYSIQISVMLLWLIVLFLVDYVFRYDFRQTQWMVISYVALYFAGMGGMIGLAALAGRGWTLSAIILFFITAILAFAQRTVTGI